MANQEHPERHTPPFFSSWPKLYAFILIVHALVIGLFFLFTAIFNFA